MSPPSVLSWRRVWKFRSSAFTSLDSQITAPWYSSLITDIRGLQQQLPVERCPRRFQWWLPTSRTTCSPSAPPSHAQPRSCASTQQQRLPIHPPPQWPLRAWAHCSGGSSGEGAAGKRGTRRTRGIWTGLRLRLLGRLLPLLPPPLAFDIILPSLLPPFQLPELLF